MDGLSKVSMQDVKITKLDGEGGNVVEGLCSVSVEGVKFTKLGGEGGNG